MDALWNVGTLDRVVFLFPMVVAVVIVFGILYRKGRKRRVKTAEFWEPIVASLTVLLLFVGIYAGYASFRNQTRLAAETALNDGADNLFAVEIANPQLRCLYRTYGHDNPPACLVTLVGDPALWSLAIFYVEESWFTLEKAAEDRRNWGSQYATDIAYWADDVSDDPTGMFSYYLLNQYGLAGVGVEMDRAGVCIPDLCTGYSKVRTALARAGALTASPDICAGPEARAKARTACQDQ